MSRRRRDRRRDGRQPPQASGLLLRPAEASLDADSSHSRCSSPRQVRSLAFYLPQFHPIPENDEWWEPGFTEWTNVTRAVPAFEGHHQPHLPADLGFYDLRLAEARSAQAELAHQYGIQGFVYYHYWFEGKRLLETPFEQVRATGAPDFPFALCWANEDWRSRWNGTTGELLMKQTYSRADDEAHIQYLIECFRDPRYIRIDGKPIFLVYRAAALPNPRRTAALWRARAREAGVGELLLLRVESGFPGETGDPEAIGFDAAVEFQPDWGRLPVPDAHLAPRAVIDYNDVVDAMLEKPKVPYRRFPGVTPRWDNTARRPSDGVIFRNSSPSAYGRWLRDVAERVKREDSDPVIFVNAWNEWAEGNHLEPCSVYGHQYLEAHANAVGAMAPGIPVGVRDQLGFNLRRFRELEELTRRSAAAARDEEALQLAGEAARWARYHHSGIFTSPLLERLIHRIACRALPAADSSKRRPGDTRRVLHTISNGDGYAEVAEAWMKLDKTAVHSVALVDIDRPSDAVIEATRLTGGQVHLVNQPGLLERAGALRELGADADFVVLHVQPTDVVSAAAFASRNEHAPTTILVSQADCVFWLGAASADLVVTADAVGREISLNRRGLQAERLAHLPLPVRRAERAVSARSARAQLGLPAEATVLLATFDPESEPPQAGGAAPVFDMLQAVVEDHDNVVLVLASTAGASPAWQAASKQMGNGVVVLDGENDLPLVRQASDLFLDWNTLASRVPALDSALLGIPVISFAPQQGVPPAVTTPVDEPPGWLTARTVESLRANLEELLGASTAHGQLRLALAAEIAEQHCGPAWAKALHDLYVVAEVCPPAVLPPSGLPQVPEPLDDLLLSLQDTAGVRRRSEASPNESGVPRRLPEVARRSGSRVALSVVLAVEGAVNSTVECLETVLEACSAEARLEVVVVDNASQDSTHDLVASLAGDIKSRRLEETVAPALAWQYGAAMTTGDFVLFLSNDVRLVPGFLEPLLRRIDAEPGPAVAPLLEQGDARRSTSGLDSLSSLCLLTDRKSLESTKDIRVVNVPEVVVSVLPRRV